MEVRPPEDGFPALTPEEVAALPHDDLGPTMVATSWALVAIALVFIVLRVYCKITRKRALWWDDHFLVVSWLLLAASTGLITKNASLGYGKHIWDISIENFLFKMPLIINLSATFAILASAWSKTSFAITLLRISQGWVWGLVWCIIVSMNVLLGLSALFNWIQCSPVEKSWNPTVEGTCYPMGRIVDYLMVSSGYSAAMDFVLALLPWKLIWPLNMRKKEKIGAIFAMSMGVFAGITGIIKLAQTPRMKDGDVYNGVVLIIWSTAESAITMMAASVPVLRTLLRQDHESPKKQPLTAPMTKRTATTETFSMGSKSTVVSVGSSSRSSSEKRVSFWGLLASEEKNSRHHAREGSGQIWRVNEVAVKYEPRKAEDV